MRISQFLCLGICFMFGIIWIFLFQSWLFLNIFPGLLLGPGLNLEEYLQIGSSPSFMMLWISCVVAMAIWLFVTFSAKPRNSDDVLKMKRLWLLAMCLLVMLGWLYQLFFTVFIWQVRGSSPANVAGMNFYPIPPGGWIFLMTFVIFDVILLFWLPTLLASPKSYRLVVPGAIQADQLFGGR
jgi:hypothetical protein